ncbi:UPF0149 family protein [Cellvibrio japonicus]|uniref:YecA family protein n=1 Tax=Cellvibrio japonicus (strain Ueda107) TaxID=498211 RepID=B3PH96_CELJU|nr:UPF0149 family protein [Cellvibrio japonicus]ACE84183.1 yecA family protein [Cellvibrio japonicus Ueda107]QEI11015.1 UPF0149 family protein [Cellvibrio japonicus]QEI14590.1 UPF0149 family protein [Cellvibrio japonicus]QEI18169.1 UPF0149 family protein [Cellvibrio japonicus]
MTDRQPQTYSPLSFDDLANLLAPLGTLNSPSELHGLLCGKLAGGAQLTEINWLLEAVEFLDFVSAPDEKVRIALTHLYHNTLQALQGDFNLKLMLPDDDTLLSDRARCLSQWCHGFLTGFGSVELATKRELDEEAQDMLQDFSHIVQIQVDDEEDEPSAEADYMEVVEYVRMATNSLYLEFAPAQSDAADKDLSSANHQTVH